MLRFGVEEEDSPLTVVGNNALSEIIQDANQIFMTRNGCDNGSIGHHSSQASANFNGKTSIKRVWKLPEQQFPGDQVEGRTKFYQRRNL